jgi:pSer/pThr/pTyr-binding forkhead associated (FHA) protein
MATPPTPIASIRLVISGVEIVLGPGDHLLGRAADCAVFVEDPLASRHHAAIAVGPEGVTIRDLGSRNGVILNGEEIDHNHALSVGDLITIGSQALTVIAILRSGEEERPLTPPLGITTGPRRSALKSAPLARIAVQKRAVRETLSPLDAASALTTINQISPLERSAEAFRMIAAAAMRAIATNRPEKAEKILEDPLLEVLATLRAGHEVDCDIVDLAVQQALCLCEITRQTKWASYVHDVYDQMRLPMPATVADRLAAAMQRPK